MARRAITYWNFGPAEEVLSLEELPTGSPGAGEVLVRRPTSGVNLSDIRARTGGRSDACDRAGGLETVRAAHVFDYSEEDLAEKILDVTEGTEVDRIDEVEFGKNVDTNARLVAESGAIASFGSAKDMAPTLPFCPLMFDAVTIDLILVYLLKKPARDAAIAALGRLLAEEALDLKTGRVRELAECAKAHDLIVSGQRAGSVILRI